MLLRLSWAIQHLPLAHPYNMIADTYKSWSDLILPATALVAQHWEAEHRLLLVNTWATSAFIGYKLIFTHQLIILRHWLTSHCASPPRSQWLKSSGRRQLIIILHVISLVEKPRSFRLQDWASNRSNGTVGPEPVLPCPWLAGFWLVGRVADPNIESYYTQDVLSASPSWPKLE
jgi:hypothetical protein